MKKRIGNRLFKFLQSPCIKLPNANEYLNIRYLNGGERYEGIYVVDHRNYAHSLSSCEFKAGKKFRPERDSNRLMTSEIML